MHPGRAHVVLAGLHRHWPAGFVDARILDEDAEPPALNGFAHGSSEPVEPAAVALADAPFDPDARHAEAVARGREGDPRSPRLPLPPRASDLSRVHGLAPNTAFK